MKKLKTVLCTVLALAMMFAVLVIPASAADVKDTSGASVAITGKHELTGDPEQNYDLIILASETQETIYAKVKNPANKAIKGIYWYFGSQNQTNQTAGQFLQVISSTPGLDAKQSTAATLQAGDRFGTDTVYVRVVFADNTYVEDSALIMVYAGTYIGSIAITPQTSYTSVGQTFQLKATLSGETLLERYISYDKLVWTSSEPGIVKVDKDSGEVTAISPGTAKITATAVKYKGATPPSATATVVVGMPANYTGFHKEDGGWYWYDNGVKNATSKAPYTGAIYGTVEGKTGWWRTVNGKADTAYTGLTYFTAKPGQNGGGWWYFENGYITGKWTGFVTNAAGTWYVKNSQVNFKETGVVYNPKDGNWYFVKNSKLTPGPDVEPNAAGWWYIDNTGKVDFNKTSVEHNKAGWWRIENGKVNFNFNGLASNAAGTWVIKGGKVNFNYNGKYNYKGHTYNIKNGKVV